jgi:7-cyano-7-deazaguanine synthase in queuosine biosynthesis
MSKYFVPWSGGLDSTALIFHLLEEGHEVVTGYIELSNNLYKTKREERARSKILPFIKDYGTHSDLGTVVQLDYLVPNVKGFFQQTLFSSLLFHVIPDDCDLAIGYVNGDGVIPFLVDIENMWSALISQSSGATNKIIFPFIRKRKTDIISYIPYKLIKYVTWCESPDDENLCGVCTPCRRMVFEEMSEIAKWLK